MSSVQIGHDFRNSTHFVSGEPFRGNHIMNAVRCSRERALQIIAEMRDRGEIVKIAPDTYRKKRPDDMLLRHNWGRTCDNAFTGLKPHRFLGAVV